jgi:hypothetical protein
MPQTFTFTWQYAVTVGSAETLATPVYWIPYSTHLIVPDQTVQLVAGTEPYAADLTFRRSVSTPPTLGNNIRTSATNLTGGPANWQLGGARYDTYPDQIQWPGVGPVSVPAGQYLQASIVANISDVPAGFSVSIVGDYLDPTITLQWCLPYGSEQTFGPWPNAFSIGGPLGQNLYAASAATTGNGLGYTPNATLYLDHPDGSSETIAGPSLILGTGQPGPIWPLTTPVTVRVGDKLRTVANSAAMSATPPGCMVVTFALQPPAPPPPLVFPSNPNVGDDFEHWHWDGTAWRCGTYVPPVPPEPKTIVFGPGAFNWPIPADFNPNDFLIECWGGAGGGAGGYTSGVCGGGGGAYGRYGSPSPWPSIFAASFYGQVGAGGAGSVGNLSGGGGPAAANGGDTYAGGTLAGAICSAPGGQGGGASALNSYGGIGVGGAQGVGSFTAAGGNSGSASNIRMASGGGGAGGPHGAGEPSPNATTSNNAYPGGAGDAGQGGAGGAPLTGAQGTASPGGDSDTGGGGGGGMEWMGGTGQVGVGGAGGKPGGGGGACSGAAQSPSITGGRGGDGEIRITYTPRA